MKNHICFLFAVIALLTTQLTAQTASPEPKAISAPAEVLRDKFAMPWGGIAERDIQWKKRTWCDFDLQAKDLKVGGQHGVQPSGSELAGLLKDEILKGNIVPYLGSEQQFRTELTKDEVAGLATGFDPTEIHKFRIKGDWLYIPMYNLMTYRILGVAPLKEVTGTDGKTAEAPAFWVYYPNARVRIAEYKMNGEKLNKDWDKFLIAMQEPK